MCAAGVERAHPPLLELPLLDGSSGTRSPTEGQCGGCSITGYTTVRTGEPLPGCKCAYWMCGEIHPGYASSVQGQSQVQTAEASRQDSSVLGVGQGAHASTGTDRAPSDAVALIFKGK